MAKRTGTVEHDDLTRDKIQVSQLINCLQKHALGETEMGMSRIQAAKILLSKKLPDLQATQHAVDPNANVIRIIHESK